MTFEITGKVALITGAYSGLGYQTARKLLEQGLKGVAVLGLDETRGQKVQEEFREEFGESSAIFIKTDVAQSSQIEDAFKLTAETFKQLDIVINNAGVISEINWKRCFDTNLGGCFVGTKLAIDNYLPKYKSGAEGVIINIASILGLQPLGITPAYTVTKHGIVTLGRAYGAKEHYGATKVRVLTICPGHMKTPLLLEPKADTFNEEYLRRYNLKTEDFPIQEVEFVAESLVDIMKKGENGSVWVVEGGEPAYEVEFPDRFSMRKK